MKRAFLYILTLLFVLSSCERRIEYDGEITEPKLVLQAEVSEGDTIVKAYVSRSRFFLNDSSYFSFIDYRMPSATVEIQRGGQAWQKMHTRTIMNKGRQVDQYFTISLDSALRAGETIRIRASHQNYDTITAEQTIVHKPWCQALNYNGQPKTLRRNEAFRCVELSLLLQNYPFTDAHLGLNVSCSYHMRFQIGSSTGITYGTTTSIRSYDQLFAAKENASASQAGFSSRYELFARSDYQNAHMLDLEIPYDSYSEDTKVLEFTIDSMTLSFNAHGADSYLYRRSMYKAKGDNYNEDFDLGAEMSDILGQEEDVQIYSNVANGYGIFAACSRYKIVMKNIQTVTQ